MLFATPDKRLIVTCHKKSLIEIFDTWTHQKLLERNLDAEIIDIKVSAQLIMYTDEYDGVYVMHLKDGLWT